MEYPQVAAVNGGNDITDQTDHTVNLPADIVSGNLLLVFFASHGAPTITFPEGWTQLFQTANGADHKFGCWYRIADGTEGATIAVTTSVSEATAYTSYRITGYSWIPEAGESVTGTSLNPDPPSLTASWEGAKDVLWFACCGYTYRRTVTDYPDSFTDGRNDWGDDPSYVCGVGTARHEFNARTNNPGVFTLSASNSPWVANTIAVKPKDIPTVTTQDCTEIAKPTATGNGTITDIGLAPVTQHGHCWSVSANPTIADSKTENGAVGVGAFTSAITGLTPGTLYHTRAYATNSYGTAYGADVEFTTLVAVALPTVTTDPATSVEAMAAIGNGNITDNGGEDCDKRGFVYNTSPYGDPGDIAPADSEYSNYVEETDSFGTGAFTGALTSLEPKTTYYVRAYAHNSAGYSYGNEVEFTTLVAIPTVTTQEMTDVEATTATGNGNVTDLGGESLTQHGHCWSTSHNPTTSDDKTELGAKSETGAFTSSLTGLSPNTVYYCRAYATNSAGTSYGSEVSFTTPAKYKGNPNIDQLIYQHVERMGR